MSTGWQPDSVLARQWVTTSRNREVAHRTNDQFDGANSSPDPAESFCNAAIHDA
jgi:hypothetical protein